MGDTIQEDLLAAFEEHEGAEENGSKAQEQTRDESGKFAPKENESETQAAARLQPDDKAAEPKTTTTDPAAATADPDGQWTQDKAPQSWTPGAREKWMSIPEDIRREIVRREEASVMGVRKLMEDRAPVDALFKGIEPYVMEAHQAGISPDAYIGTVLNSERILRKADVPTKFQEILRIADQYGVPLREIVNQSVGQQVLAAPQAQQQGYVPPQVMQELQQVRQWQQTQEEQFVQREVATFSADKEFFNDVKGQMATLVESGAAATLADAYDQACWANPQVRAVLLDRERHGGKKEELKQRQTNAASASLKPAGAVDVKLNSEEDEDLAATVRGAFTDAQTGRV